MEIAVWIGGIAIGLWALIWCLRHYEAILGGIMGLSCWLWCNNLIPGWLNRLVCNIFSRF